MKIVEAKSALKERGFEGAVELGLREIRRAVMFQAIVNFALEEGKGSPIIEEDGKKMILIQIKDTGGQYAFPADKLGASLVPFVSS